MELSKMAVFLIFVPTICLSTVLSAQSRWHEYAENPVLSPGAPGEWDDYMVANPFVLYDNRTYMMWYHGHPGPDTSSAMGLATSSDGVNWTKYAGNPVMNVGSGWDSGYIFSPSVIKENGIFKMWYSGRQGLAGHGTIGFANSTDGIHWTKYEGNPVLSFGTSGSWDDVHATDCTVIKDGDVYKMWYRGYNTTGSGQIGYANSTDGLNWTKYSGNPVLTTGPSGSPDSKQTSRPAVIKDEGLYRMWYQGYNGSLNTICYATSPNEISWSRYANNPVLIKSGIHVSVPMVLNENGIYRMWYCEGLTSTPPTCHEICYAYSGISISEPARDPVGTVQPNQNITISVNVTAIQGVTNVILAYITNRTVAWQNITMAPTSGATYQVVMPGQQANTLVTYKIMANDTFGDIVVKDGAAAWCTIEVVPEFSLNPLLLMVVFVSGFLVWSRHLHYRMSATNNKSIRRSE